MGTLVKAAQAFLFCLISFLSPSSTFGQSDDLAMKSQRAREFMATGKFAEAVPLYRELNQSVPNNPGLLLNLGMALHMAGDERNSIPKLEAAVKLDPKLAPAWLFLGAARLQLGKSPAAIEALKMVLGLQPDHRGALEMLAESRICTGATLLAHGFNVDMLAGLIRDGLAIARREPVKVDGQMVKVARLRITNAGRSAIEGRAP